MTDQISINKITKPLVEELIENKSPVLSEKCHENTIEKMIS